MQLIIDDQLYFYIKCIICSLGILLPLNILHIHTILNIVGTIFIEQYCFSISAAPFDIYFGIWKTHAR